MIVNQEWRGERGSRKGGHSSGMGWRQMEKWRQVSDCGLKSFNAILEWCFILEWWWQVSDNLMIYLNGASLNGASKKRVRYHILILQLRPKKSSSWREWKARQPNTWLSLICRLMPMPMRFRSIGTQQSIDVLTSLTWLVWLILGPDLICDLNQYSSPIYYLWVLVLACK